MTSGDVKLELRNLRKVFDDVVAVKDADLILRRGEFLSLPLTYGDPC